MGVEELIARGVSGSESAPPGEEFEAFSTLGGAAVCGAAVTVLRLTKAAIPKAIRVMTAMNCQRIFIKFLTSLNLGLESYRKPRTQSCVAPATCQYVGPAEFVPVIGAFGLQRRDFTNLHRICSSGYCRPPLSLRGMHLRF